MPVCRICGESKPRQEFYNISNFTKFKKQKVIWCRCCQKMWMEARKQKEYIDQYLNGEQKFTVSFE